MEKYVEMLRGKNLKVTSQRLDVIRFLDQNRNHPTADEIYRALKERNPSLSKTTVYNVLDVLRDNDMVSGLTISGTESRFDLKTVQHHHFYCRTCGRIFDMDIEGVCIDCVHERGHKVEEVHGYFKGTCEDCLKGVGGHGQG